MKEHLKLVKDQQPKEEDVIEEIDDSLYIDDIMGGGMTVDKAKQLKETSVDMCSDAKIELQKWHSDESVVGDLSNKSKGQTYAKQVPWVFTETRSQRS